MLPLLVGRKVREDAEPDWVKPEMVIAGADLLKFGTATSRYHGLADVPLPFFSITNEVEPTAIVSPPMPVPVVQAGIPPGDAQKPVGSGPVRPSAREDGVQMNTKARTASKQNARFADVLVTGRPGNRTSCKVSLSVCGIDLTNSRGEIGNRRAKRLALEIGDSRSKFFCTYYMRRFPSLILVQSAILRRPREELFLLAVGLGKSVHKGAGSAG